MKSRYGRGSITAERGRFRVRVPDGKGKHKTVGTYDTEEEAEQMRDAALLARGEQGIGITLRQYGEAYLMLIAHQRNVRSWRTTWRTIVLESPFADMPLATLTFTEVDTWARSLTSKKKKRSVHRDGARITIELDAPISRQTALHALGLLRRCLDAARRDGHVDTNVATDADVPVIEQRSDAGVVIVSEPVTYLSAVEVEQLLGFEHLPLEQRIVLTLSVCQCPREGELAGMDWERVDWAQHGWWIARSWGGTTKNGKTRWQTLLPRAFAALRLWWEHCGSPASGIVFPRRLGRPMVGKTPRRPKRHRPAPPARYARGYDWGWADHRESKVTRLGWWRRAGLRTRIVFHEFRDTCATHLLSGTWGEPWSIEDVSEHLGHGSIEVTRQRYAHFTREARLRKALAMGVQTPAANLPHAVSGETMLTTRNDLASQPRFERGTFGLGILRPLANHPQKAAIPDDARQVCGRLAGALLALLAIGSEIPGELVAEMAAAARELRLFKLVDELEHGAGPFQLDRAIELAVLLGGADWVAAAPAARGAVS